MPAELSAAWYPCLIKGCDEYFISKEGREKHLKEVHNVCLTPEKTEAGETKAEESKPEESKPEESKPEESKPEESKAEAPKAKEPKADPTAKEIQCSYSWCHETFASMEDMTSHKCARSDHIYCQECDVDCEDWEDYVKHMVSSDKHIACGICGMEFNSEAGLKRHVKIRHPRDQNIKCRGCDEKFPSAAAVVSHIEKGQCRNKKDPGKSITKEKFKDHVNHKGVVKTLVSQLDYQYKNIGIGPKIDPAQPFDPSKAPPTTSEAAWSNNPVPGNSDIWPDLVKNMNTKDVDLINFESDEEKGKGSSKKNTTGAWGTNTPGSKVLFPDSNGKTVSATNEDAADSRKRAGSEGLSDKSESRNAGAYDIKTQRLIAYASQNTGKVFDVNSQFWNPKTKDYDPEIFYDEARGCYRCPHNSYTLCFYHTQDPNELTTHLLTEDHDRDRLYCPACLKRFPTLTGLVAHCESYTKKCPVRNLPAYDTIMERLTGGHVKIAKKTQTAEAPKTSTRHIYANWDRTNAAQRHAFLDEMHSDEAKFEAGENHLKW